MMIGFPVYATSCMTIIGFLMLIFFLPTGTWAIPFRLFGLWAMRPVSMSKMEFEREKDELSAKIKVLLQ